MGGKCAFFGIFLEIPKNDVNERFSGFQKYQGQGKMCVFRDLKILIFLFNLCQSHSRKIPENEEFSRKIFP